MSDSHLYLPKGFEQPDLQLPTQGEIKDDSQHPQLNTEDFQHQIYTNYTKPSGFLPFYCFLDCTDDSFIVGTNNFTSIIADSNLLGTPDFNVIVNRDASKMSFQKPELHNLSCAKFLDADTIVTTTENYQMQLWSTKLAVHGNPDAGPQKVGTYHTGGTVKGISKLTGSEFIVATKQDLKVMNYGSNEVRCAKPFIKAHSKEIFGVSAHPTSSKMFATCAADKNCVQWDMNQSRAANHILRKYDNQMTAVYWSNQEENKELVMVGDEIGNLLTLDPRSPNQIANKMRVSNRGIRKIIFNGTKQFAVIARSNEAYILVLDDGGDPKLVHKHIAPGIIYDFCWDRKDKRKFYVVGEHYYAATGTILA